MTASRAFVTLGIVIAVLGTAAQGRADVVVLFENFNDDIDTVSDATDAAITKADADSSTSFFVTSTGSSGDRGYWGIYDSVSTTDDFDGATPPSLGSGGGEIPGVSPTYSGFTGNFLVGENLDRAGASTNVLPLSLTWSNLDISGLSDITFSGVFAAQAATWEAGDFVVVQYRFDGTGTFTDLLQFSGGGAGNHLSVDADFNETGDGTTNLGLVAQSFMSSISGTGTTLDLRILMSSNATGEDFAFDSIQIAGVPEPGAFLFGGLACGVVWLRAGGRRLFSGVFRRDAA